MPLSFVDMPLLRSLCQNASHSLQVCAFTFTLQSVRCLTCFQYTSDISGGQYNWKCWADQDRFGVSTQHPLSGYKSTNGRTRFIRTCYLLYYVCQAGYIHLEFEIHSGTPRIPRATSPKISICWIQFWATRTNTDPSVFPGKCRGYLLAEAGQVLRRATSCTIAGCFGDAKVGYGTMDGKCWGSCWIRKIYNVLGTGEAFGRIQFVVARHGHHPPRYHFKTLGHSARP